MGRFTLQKFFHKYCHFLPKIQTLYQTPSERIGISKSVLSLMIALAIFFDLSHTFPDKENQIEKKLHWIVSLIYLKQDLSKHCYTGHLFEVFLFWTFLLSLRRKLIRSRIGWMAGTRYHLPGRDRKPSPRYRGRTSWRILTT